MFNNNVLNKVEYTRNQQNKLWIAHAHHVGKNEHVYATGRTMDLLKHNMTQNIANRGLNPRTFIWDEHSVDNIYMAGATERFVKRYVNIDEQKAQGMNKKKVVRAVQVDPNAQEVITKEVDGMIVVYAVKEIARYKKAECIL